MPPQLRLSRVRATNYKAFEAPIELELAPLTIIFGRNGSGKSALTRLPLALAEALSGLDSPGLPLQARGIGFGNSLLSFVHGAINGEFSVGATIQASDGKMLDLDVVIHKDPKSAARLPGQWIGRWELRSDGKSIAVFSWNRRDKHYDVEGVPGTAAPVSFSGLLPLLADRSVHPVVNVLRPTPHVIHLGASRGIPGEDFVVQQPNTPLDVGLTGTNTRRVLGSLRSSSHSELLAAVVDRVRQCFDYDLRVQDVAQGAVQGTVLEAKPCGRSTWLPLSETGTGLAHALPVIVQYVLAAHPSEDNPPPSTLACEEPEAHAHPQIQARLADVILAVGGMDGCRTLIETHSETFVLRVRRRVAEGLKPESVALYWVDDEQATTCVRRLSVDHQGNVENWPEGWFDTAMDEVSAIHRAMGHT